MRTIIYYIALSINKTPSLSTQEKKKRMNAWFRMIVSTNGET